MARIATLRERVQAIIRKWEYVNAQKFLYNDKRELRQYYKKIKVWYLIHDSERGYSIINLTFNRKEQMSVAQWSTLHKKRVGNYDSLYNVFTQAILPAINNKGGNAWRFISLLCWTGQDELQRAKDTASPKRRNKTSKARNAKPRNRNRR